MERFVVLLYDRTSTVEVSTEEGENQATKQLFSKKAELLMVCLLRRLHSSNTPRDLHTKLVTAGPK